MVTSITVLKLRNYTSESNDASDMHAIVTLNPGKRAQNLDTGY